MSVLIELPTADNPVVVIEGDCLDVLRHLPAECVDAVVTDPPYGIAEKWVGGGGGQLTSWKFRADETHSWDGKIDASVVEIVELAKKCIIWGGNYYPLPPSRCWLLWDKCQPDTWTTAQAEMAWTNIDRPVRTYRMCQAMAHDEMSPKEHPTQKPVSLMRWCMKWIPDADLILDPFAGSGTTGVAAILEGRRCILIEKEPKYAAICRRRIAEAMGRGPGQLPFEAPDLFSDSA